MPEVGVHNKDLDVSVDRLEKSKSYRDLSTIIICPTRGQIPARVVQSWMGLMRPMNQKVIGPIFAIGMEVGAAYNSLIENTLPKKTEQIEYEEEPITRKVIKKITGTRYRDQS